MEIHLRNNELRFLDPQTGHFLLALGEAEAARRAAERARHEAVRQTHAEAERRLTAEARRNTSVYTGFGRIGSPIPIRNHQVLTH